MVAMMLVFATNAQVTIGSVIGSGQDISLDFNSDGEPEFDISAAYIKYYDYGANNNIWAAGTSLESGGYDWDFPLALEEGTTIDDGGNWIGMGDAFLIMGFEGEQFFVEVGEYAYIGFRIDLNGSIHYGWANLTLAGGEGDDGYYAIVDELAYNATPNAPIAAGQTTDGGSGINEMADNQANVYPNPFNSNLTIEMEGMQEYQVCDLVGRVVASEKVAANAITIKLSSLDKGIYVVRIKANDAWITKKIVKQ